MRGSRKRGGPFRRSIRFIMQCVDMNGSEDGHSYPIWLYVPFFQKDEANCLRVGKLQTLIHADGPTSNVHMSGRKLMSGVC